MAQTDTGEAEGRSASKPRLWVILLILNLLALGGLYLALRRPASQAPVTPTAAPAAPTRQMGRVRVPQAVPAAPAPAAPAPAAQPPQAALPAPAVLPVIAPPPAPAQPASPPAPTPAPNPQDMMALLIATGNAPAQAWLPEGSMALPLGTCPGCPDQNPPPDSVQPAPAPDDKDEDDDDCAFNPWPYVRELALPLAFFALLAYMLSLRESRLRHAQAQMDTEERGRRRTAEAEAATRQQTAEAAAETRRRAVERRPLEDEVEEAQIAFNRNPKSPAAADRLRRAYKALARFDGQYDMGKAKVDIHVQPAHMGVHGGPDYLPTEEAAEEPSSTP